MADDLFDGALNIEEDLYVQGYQEGLADGEQAGRLEGRSFGMTKGFEKFVQSSKLHGKSVIWANRLPSTTSSSTSVSNTATAGRSESQSSESQVTLAEAAEKLVGDYKQQLPPLSHNTRLARNIETIHALMEPDTLSTENSDEAVQDFDDRLRSAQGKAKVVERMISGKQVKEDPDPAT